MANVAIIYYSSTGNTHKMAEAAAEGAREAGADVRLRRAKELAPDAAIDSNPNWRAHIEATSHIEEATPDDLEWADGYLLGTPTRFGLPTAQLKQFIDQCGGKWAAGALQDKAAGAFTGAGNMHGGQESTLLALQNVFYHWGAVIVPPGYTDATVAAAGGNPYGASFTATAEPTSPASLAMVKYQAARVARFAAVLSANRGALKG